MNQTIGSSAPRRVVGTREEVWNGLATKTKGGLTKADLKINPQGRIVSKKKSEAAAKSIETQLFAKGYRPTKGKFELFQKKS